MRVRDRDSGNDTPMVSRTANGTFEREAHVARLISGGSAQVALLGGDNENRET